MCDITLGYLPYLVNHFGESIVKLKCGSKSKMVRLKMKLKLQAEGFNSKMVRLERSFWTTLRQFYNRIMNRVKTFFDIFDFWVALQSFGLQC